MGQVSIEVNGRSYGIACDDGEEDHIAELGRVLGERVKQLSDAVGQVGDARLLVMAGLLLTDELMQSQLVEYPTLGKVDQASNEAAAERIEALAGRIESLAQQAELVAERIEHS